MKIALTGGTGFIGSHFLRQSLNSGHDVLAIRRGPSCFPRINLDLQPIWIDCQLKDVKADDLRDCDVLVHLATHTGNLPYDTLSRCLRWNLIDVLKLFDQARLAGIQHFIVAGSCFEYGRSGERYNEIPTNAPLEPTNSYAASKAAASLSLLQWSEEYDVRLEILRVFHVFGEGELDTRLWPSLRRSAMMDKDFPMTQGEQLRDFQPVESVAKAFLDRATQSMNNELFRNIYNISSAKPTSIRQFAEKWWKHWGAKSDLLIGQIPYRKDEVMMYIPGPNYLYLEDL